MGLTFYLIALLTPTPTTPCPHLPCTQSICTLVMSNCVSFPEHLNHFPTSCSSTDMHALSLALCSTHQLHLISASSSKYHHVTSLLSFLCMFDHWTEVKSLLSNQCFHNALHYSYSLACHYTMISLLLLHLCSLSCCREKHSDHRQSIHGWLW